jgi:hypothetical protein
VAPVLLEHAPNASAAAKASAHTRLVVITRWFLHMPARLIGAAIPRTSAPFVTPRPSVEGINAPFSTG